MMVDQPEAMRRQSAPSIIAALTIVAAGLASACGGGGTTPPAVATATTLPTSAPSVAGVATSAPSPTAPTFIKTTIGFESSTQGVYGLVGYGRALWVETDDGGQPRLHRVDTVTGDIVQSLDGLAPQQVGADLWYADANGKDLVKAEIETGVELDRVTPPHIGPWAKVEDTFWIATEGKLTRWESSSDSVVAEIELPLGEPKDVIEAGDAIWVAVDGTSVLVRIEPATNKIAAEIAVGSRPHTLASGFGSVWVVNHGEPSLARVDLEDNAVTKVENVGRNVGIALLDGELLLVTTPTGLATIDTDANRVKTALEWAPGDYYALAIANGIWMSDVERRAVYRIDAGPGTPGPVDP